MNKVEALTGLSPLIQAIWLKEVKEAYSGNRNLWSKFTTYEFRRIEGECEYVALCRVWTLPGHKPHPFVGYACAKQGVLL